MGDLVTSSLGPVLELLHDARNRVATFRGEFKVWSEGFEKAAVSITRGAEESRPSLEIHGEERGSLAQVLKLWRARPGRLKMEVWQDEVLTRTSLSCDGRWSLWDADDGARRGAFGFQDQCDQLPPILDPALFVATMMFRYEGEATCLGRSVHRLTAQARSYPRGVRTFELDCDAEYGTVLRRVGYRGGLRVLSVEATVADFETPLPSDVFQESASVDVP